MSIQLPGTTGNNIRLGTTIDTSALTIFLRLRKAAATAGESWALYVGTSAGSNLDGHGTYSNETGVTEGRSIHGLVFGDNSMALSPVADWGAGSVLATVPANQWINLALCLYLLGDEPQMKVAYRLHPAGPIISDVLDPHYTFTNALIRFGAGHGGGNPFSGLQADMIVYDAVLNSNPQIEAQFNSQGPAHADPYAWFSMRGFATPALAVNDQGAENHDATAEGTGLAMSATDPTFGITLTGGGQLPATNAATSVPNVPNTVSLQDYTNNTIRIAFGTNSNPAGTRYVAEYQKQGTAEWVAGADVTSSPATIGGLLPNTTYLTRIKAVGVGGESATVAGPTQKTKKLLARAYVDASAASVTGVKAQLWRPPESGTDWLTGARINPAVAQAFETNLFVDPSTSVESARIDVPVVQDQALQIVPDDTVRLILTQGDAPADKWTKIFSATVIEVD